MTDHKNESRKDSSKTLGELQGTILIRLANELTHYRLCREDKESLEGKNILLSGVWGSGKTRILKDLVKNKVTQEDNIVVLNGCRFYVIELSLWEALSTEATPIAVFLNLMRNVLYGVGVNNLSFKDNPHVNRVLRAINESIKSVSDGLIKQGTKDSFDFTSIGIAVLLKILNKYSVLDGSCDDNFLSQTQKARKVFSKLILSLKDTTKSVQVLLIVDDLDRCKPEQAIELLDVLYQLFLPREDLFQSEDENWPVSSIWALNTPVLEEFLHSQYRDLPSFKPTDYLEKMFQVRMNIPPLSCPEHALALVKDENVDQAVQERILGILGDNKLDYACLGNLRLHKHVLKDFLTLKCNKTSQCMVDIDDLYIARCLVLIRAFSGFREQVALQRAMWPEFVNRLNHPQRMTTDFRRNPIFRHIDNPDLLTLLLDLEALGYNPEKSCYFSITDGQEKLKSHLFSLMQEGY